MPTDELTPLFGVDWPEHDHRFALTRLERLGWSACGRGDWAYVLRSPSGRSAARVSPFEHGYELFVALCEHCADNRYLPRIELASRLQGGGHLAVLEFLTASPPTVAEDFLRRWHGADDADPELTALRQAVDVVDRRGRADFARRIPADQRRHLLDVPDLHTDHPESYLNRVRAALAALDSSHHRGGTRDSHPVLPAGGGQAE